MSDDKPSKQRTKPIAQCSSYKPYEAAGRSRIGAGAFGVAGGRFKPECAVEFVGSSVHQEMKSEKVAFAQAMEVDPKPHSRLSQPSLIDDLGVHALETASAADIGPREVKPLDMLNGKVLNYLEKMRMASPEDIVGHEDVYYHIESYIEAQSQMFPTKFKFGSAPALLKVLKELVFNEEFASKAANSIPEEFLLSQDAAYWAIRYLEDWQLCDQDGPYYYRERCQDQWFVEDVPLPRRLLRGAGPGMNNVKKVNIYNVARNAVYPDQFQNTNEHTYHFHGTKIYHLKKFLSQGIDLGKGKSAKDYSDGSGFYVSSDFQQAVNWADRDSTAQTGYPIVLVFKTPRDFFSDRKKHIHLIPNELKTVAFIRYFRSGCDDKEAEEVEKIADPSIYDCHSISGPILFDIENFFDNKSLVLRSLQTCIRNKACTDQFFLCLDSIVFNQWKNRRDH